MLTCRQTLLVEIRIPYCIRKEPFRRQLQLTGSNAEKNAYMEALRQELLSWKDELDGYEVPALRLSGGNATVMSPDLLGELIRSAREILPLTQGAEISVDAQPLTIGTPALTGLAAGRPNRMELMMRSGKDEELRALGCAHTTQQVNNAILFFNRFHINNYGLTIDLGIPGQTEQSWHNTLHACTIYHPAHIHLQTPEIRDAEGMPEEETRFSWYCHAVEYLKENGYLRYASGDFCLPQHASRFTLAQLDAPAFLTLGLGAVSLMDSYLTRSTNKLSIYLAFAGNYEKTTAELFSVEPEWCMQDYVEHRLHSPEGLSHDAFLARFGCPLPEKIADELAGRAGKGLLTETSKGFLPSERGLFSML